MLDLISIIISVSFWIIAAICNAVLDITNHKFYLSIFTNEKTWNPDVSWRNKYIEGDPENGRVVWFRLGAIKVIKPVQITDGFHFVKMLMIMFACASIVSYRSFGWELDLVFFVFYGVMWNITFSLFYDKVLIKK